MDRFGQEQPRYADAGPACGRGLPRFAETFVAYLRSRTAEHWIMFAGGLALGVLLG